MFVSALLIAAFPACGQNNATVASTASDQNTQITQNTQETEQTSSMNEETLAPATDLELTNVTESTEVENTEAESLNDAEQFVAFTAIDNDECSVKITDIQMDSLWGYTVKVLLENKSDSKTYMYSVESAAVNGVSWDPFFATEVSAGKKKNDSITFSNDEKEALLSEFTDIELVIRVYDSDDWAAENVAHECVRIYPMGENKVKAYVREPQPTDLVLVDNDQLSIIVTGYDSDPIWGYSANLYLKNKTDDSLMFNVEDVSVNGFMCDPFWANEIAPGKIDFSKISWSDSSFEENGITQVETIELKFRVYDANDLMSGNIFSEAFTLEP